jgi:hypothetical protein
VNAACKPDRFKTKEEYLVYLREYGAAWREKNREDVQLVAHGLVPRRYKSNDKKRKE